MGRGGGERGYPAGLEDRKETCEPRNAGSCWKLEKASEQIRLQSLQKEHDPANPFQDFWPPELQENQYEFWKDIKLVVICYDNNRKLIHKHYMYTFTFEK